MMLRRSLRNPILRQISTPRIPCETSSSRNVWRRGPARKRNPRSARMKHLRKGEHARGKRRRRRNYSKEGRTPCETWRSCSNPWEVQETKGKRCLREGVEAEVPHHPGETVTSQNAVGPLDHIPPVRAGEVQADPGPHGGKNSQDSCELTPADVPNSIVSHLLNGLCDVNECTGTTGVRVGAKMRLSRFIQAFPVHFAAGKAILPHVERFLQPNPI